MTLRATGLSDPTETPPRPGAGTAGVTGLWWRRPPRRLVLCGWLGVVAEFAVAAGFLFTGPGAPGPGEVWSADGPRGGVAGILDGTAPSGDRVDHADRTEAVRDLLARRSRAILERDRAGFLATVDPAAPELRARQAAFFDSLAEVPLATWAYQVRPERQTALPPGVAAAYGDAVWAPQVRLRYALAGYDPVATTQERRYLFARTGRQWYLADDGLAPDGSVIGEGTVRNLWDFGPVRAVAGPRVLVLGHPGSDELMRSVLDTAEAAVPAVSEVWPAWRQRVVILVPDDADELGRLVEEPGDLSTMAAFTSADVPHSGPPVGRRIVVNPDTFGRLSPSGRRIVITHELTHVATRRVTSVHTPLWLAEGFADYVAYRGEGVAAHRAARELAREVRAGDLPDGLPGRGDFAADAPRLGQAYQESWLACRMIVERGGEAALVRLYRRLSAAGGDPQAALDVALRDELGFGEADFVAAWRRYLDRRLGDR